MWWVVVIIDCDVIGLVVRVGLVVLFWMRSLNGEGGLCWRRLDLEVLDIGFLIGYINFMVIFVVVVNCFEDVVGWMSFCVDDYLDCLGYCVFG